MLLAPGQQLCELFRCMTQFPESQVYLMYSYARIKSIARKAGVEPTTLHGVAPSVGHVKELALVLHILKFPEVPTRP